ncbi:hypothetical protein ADUPG1_009265, partial [Aduncisulcus paluster]
PLSCEELQKKFLVGIYGAVSPFYLHLIDPSFSFSIPLFIKESSESEEDKPTKVKDETPCSNSIFVDESGNLVVDYGSSVGDEGTSVYIGPEIPVVRQVVKDYHSLCCKDNIEQKEREVEQREKEERKKRNPDERIQSTVMASDDDLVTYNYCYGLPFFPEKVVCQALSSLCSISALNSSSTKIRLLYKIERILPQWFVRYKQPTTLNQIFRLLCIIFSSMDSVSDQYYDSMFIPALYISVNESNKSFKSFESLYFCMSFISVVIQKRPDWTSVVFDRICKYDFLRVLMDWCAKSCHSEIVVIFIQLLFSFVSMKGRQENVFHIMKKDLFKLMNRFVEGKKQLELSLLVQVFMGFSINSNEDMRYLAVYPTLSDEKRMSILNNELLLAMYSSIKKDYFLSWMKICDSVPLFHTIISIMWLLFRHCPASIPFFSSQCLKLFVKMTFACIDGVVDAIDEWCYLIGEMTNKFNLQQMTQFLASCDGDHESTLLFEIGYRLLIDSHKKTQMQGFMSLLISFYEVFEMEGAKKLKSRFMVTYGSLMMAFVDDCHISCSSQTQTILVSNLIEDFKEFSTRTSRKARALRPAEGIQLLKDKKNLVERARDDRERGPTQIGIPIPAPMGPPGVPFDIPKGDGPSITFVTGAPPPNMPSSIIQPHGITFNKTTHIEIDGRESSSLGLRTDGAVVDIVRTKSNSEDKNRKRTRLDYVSKEFGSNPSLDTQIKDDSSEVDPVLGSTMTILPSSVSPFSTEFSSFLTLPIALNCDLFASLSLSSSVFRVSCCDTPCPGLHNDHGWDGRPILCVELMSEIVGETLEEIPPGFERDGDAAIERPHSSHTFKEFLTENGIIERLPLPSLAFPRDISFFSDILEHVMTSYPPYSSTLHSTPHEDRESNMSVASLLLSFDRKLHRSHDSDYSVISRMSQMFLLTERDTQDWRVVNETWQLGKKGGKLVIRQGLNTNQKNSGASKELKENRKKPGETAESKKPLAVSKKPLAESKKPLAVSKKPLTKDDRESTIRKKKKTVILEESVEETKKKEEEKKRKKLEEKKKRKEEKRKKREEEMKRAAREREKERKRKEEEKKKEREKKKKSVRKEKKHETPLEKLEREKLALEIEAQKVKELERRNKEDKELRRKEEEERRKEEEEKERLKEEERLRMFEEEERKEIERQQILEEKKDEIMSQITFMDKPVHFSFLPPSLDPIPLPTSYVDEFYENISKISPHKRPILLLLPSLPLYMANKRPCTVVSNTGHWDLS